MAPKPCRIGTTVASWARGLAGVVDMGAGAGAAAGMAGMGCCVRGWSKLLGTEAAATWAWAAAGASRRAAAIRSGFMGSSPELNSDDDGPKRQNEGGRRGRYSQGHADDHPCRGPGLANDNGLGLRRVLRQSGQSFQRVPKFL